MTEPIFIVPCPTCEGDGMVPCCTCASTGMGLSGPPDCGSTCMTCHGSGECCCEDCTGAGLVNAIHWLREQTFPGQDELVRAVLDHLTDITRERDHLRRELEVERMISAAGRMLVDELQAEVAELRGQLAVARRVIDATEDVRERLEEVAP